MSDVVEATENSIRNLPIQKRLKDLLKTAAGAAGVDTVRVTSGGQPPYPGTPRIGSTRHDNGWAADLKLFRNGQVLRFTDQACDPAVAAFITAAAAHGATGMGAGVGYMGPETIHVGFGTSPTDHQQLVWGAGGKSANAPAWLRAAAQQGWNAPAMAIAAPVAPAGSPPGFGTGTHVVIARGGLRLRGGPGIEFGVSQTLAEGTVLMVLDHAGPENAWARVDLERDGLVDGFVFASFLAPVGDDAHEENPAPTGA